MPPRRHPPRINPTHDSHHDPPKGRRKDKRPSPFGVSAFRRGPVDRTCPRAFTGPAFQIGLAVSSERGSSQGSLPRRGVKPPCIDRWHRSGRTATVLGPERTVAWKPIGPWLPRQTYEAGVNLHLARVLGPLWANYAIRPAGHPSFAPAQAVMAYSSRRGRTVGHPSLSHCTGSRSSALWPARWPS